MINTNSAEYLDDHKIISIIEDYLKRDSYNYAIMLNGDWGSGKTYFVKKILIPALKNQKSVAMRSPVYVSLYGVKSVEELSNSVFMSILEDCIVEKAKEKAERKTQKIRKKIQEIRQVPIKVDSNGEKSGKKRLLKLLSPSFLFEVLSNSKVGWIKSITDSTVSTLLDYNRYYFIFDDLERCSMPINEAFGFINQFVEQNDAKTLIIADECKIGFVKSVEQDLFRLFIATQPGIKWPERENPDNKYRGAAGLPPVELPVDVSEIKRRADELIEENTFYNQIKEKLVGRTIVYKPLLEDVVPKIFDKYFKDKQIDETLKAAIIEKICSVMHKEKHYNLRTLQFSLDFFALMYCNIHCTTNRISPSNIQAVVLSVLESLLKISIDYKAESYVYEWANSSKYDRFLTKGDLNLTQAMNPYNYFNSFRFVHDYVYQGIYDLESIQMAIEDYCNDLNSGDVLDELRIYAYEMNDVDINNKLSQLAQDLKYGKYTDDYRRVLGVLFNLKDAGIEINCDDFMKIMKCQINKGTVVFSYSGFGELHSNNYVEEFRKNLDDLKAFAEECRLKKNANNLNMIFSNEQGWGEHFASYVQERNRNYQQGFQQEIIAQIDINKCKNALESGTPKDIAYFRRAICSLFEDSLAKKYFEECIDKITQLKNVLDLETDSIMKKFHLKLLSEFLEEKLTAISESKDT